METLTPSQRSQGIDRLNRAQHCKRSRCCQTYKPLVIIQSLPQRLIRAIVSKSAERLGGLCAHEQMRTAFKGLKGDRHGARVSDSAEALEDDLLKLRRRTCERRREGRSGFGQSEPPKGSGRDVPSVLVTMNCEHHC